MNTVLRLVRLACLVAGTCGLLASAWAFIDPAAFPAMQSNGPFAAPSPRWQAALAFVFSLAVLGYGAGWLRHRVRE